MDNNFHMGSYLYVASLFHIRAFGSLALWATYRESDFSPPPRGKSPDSRQKVSLGYSSVR